MNSQPKKELSENTKEALDGCGARILQIILSGVLIFAIFVIFDTLKSLRAELHQLQQEVQKKCNNTSN